ncbi:MAG: 30S ribosomal protein S16 [Elusimicrobia bacterium]|jgi:small subunit ribosomal protein S16|nr:30S ribosomal protein S16 [Elusimicrobiota bacterium]MBQ3943044.1 30S ribosomal protein S16 [Elusimicrobiota bacterium]MBQ4179036.1 30S ribosomal protein S16 [Elusimicrobiota bacterium]MBR3627340.1 30S ribosomal protein S16 [Elusimicrobiota bacterium]MBR3654503.1 30S ribosomal protein S16 [Elusimicrobiota bacterium]
MSVRIRLQRIGRPKRAYYRVVAIDQRAKRNGKPIEILGQYDPVLQENKLNVKQDRVEYWLKTGAKPSDTVADLLKKASAPAEESK